MASFLTIYLLIRVLVLATTTSIVNIQRNKDNIAECLSVLIRNEDVTFTINIRLKIKAEKKVIRRNFESTVNQFLNANDDFLVSLDLRASPLYKVHVCLYFVDSVKSFQYLVEKQRSLEHNLSGRNELFLIVLPNGGSMDTMKVMHEMIDYCSDNFIINVNILIENSSGIVTLYTFFPFNENNCRSTSPIVQNRFINGVLEWAKPSFPRKTENFHRCPLRAGIWREFPYMMINDDGKLSGIDGNTLNYLAKLMNFTIEIVMVPKGRGRIFSTKNMTGSFKLINERKGDLVIGGLASDKVRMELFAYTLEYHSTFLIIVVKRPPAYSSLEILLFPFDQLTWILILLILLLRKFCMKVSQKLTRITEATCSRKYLVPIRLMLWFFTFLILRSSYEGSIFKFLHSQPEKGIPLNLNEAIDQEFTFICETSFNFFVDQIPELARRVIQYEVPLFGIFDIFDRHQGKYALITKETYLSLYKTNSSRYSEYYIVKNPYRMLFFSIYMPKFSFLQDELNNRLAQLVQHGHIKKFRNIYVSTQNFQHKLDNREPISLSIVKLLGAFQLFATMMTLCVCIFVIEVSSRRIRVLRKIIELLD